MSEHAVDLTVTGRVQGVGYRWSCQQEAERLGVSGWVRNEPDGSVAAHAEGDRDAVQALVAWCRTGPSSAVVEDVRVMSGQAAGETGFRTTG